MHDGLLEDLLVTDIGLDQSPEAGNNSVGLLIELEEKHKDTRELFLTKPSPTRFTN